LVLPPSKKTRALLAYLAVTGRSHRRDRLCALFWDIPDDPRGALRWSLSKLRGLVDEGDTRRIVADRETVALDGRDMEIDVVALRRLVREGVDGLGIEQLEETAAGFRGEFLEGLELPDLHDFQAWCAAEREETRTHQVTVLQALVERLSDQPDGAAAHARALVHLDPFNEPARATLIRLLAHAGRRREAERQYQLGVRLFEELGAGFPSHLEAAWRGVRQLAPVTATGGSAASAPDPEPPAPSSVSEAVGEASQTPEHEHAHGTALIGREEEWSRLVRTIDDVSAGRRQRAILLTGEPGLGKTRLLQEVMAEVRRRGGTVLDGCAYEAESGRPYGPWIDALRRLPKLSVGKTTGNDLAPLLPELAGEPGSERSRDRLFGAVVEVVAARAHSAPPVLLVLDDIHWCDEASAELLHYVSRMCRHRPLLLGLGARSGEILDNQPVLGVLRGLRRDGVVEEIDLGPLGPTETAALVRTLSPDADAAQVFAESAGNPLFALEVARSLAHRTGDDVPASLGELVRERVERLPATAGEIIRWSAVLGHTVGVRALSSLTSVPLDELVAALETLERHALLQAAPAGADPQGAYRFAHDVVRRVVYNDLSEPRRRLMHWQVAKVLDGLDDPDGTIAADLANHAALGGDSATAARACVAAGRRCLRVFANGQAESLARRGLRYTEDLGEPERTKLQLELIDVSFGAHRPEQVDEAIARLEDLSERALDHGCLEHARLGFHMIAYLRWEGGAWSDAQRNSLRAELISRSADEAQQVVGMAEAARCLTMLERDLGSAEVMLLEAGALAKRTGVEPNAIPDGLGMLRYHQGSLEEAAGLFLQARALAAREGDRINEFQALEHLVMVEMERGRLDRAAAYCHELARLGDKLRGGSEAPFARALNALCDCVTGDAAASARLDEALKVLRLADAKYRLAFLLTRAAEIDLQSGRAEKARERATEALAVSQALERPSEIALSRTLLARAASALGEREAAAQQLAALRAGGAEGVSSHARAAMESAMAALMGGGEQPRTAVAGNA
jgi:DNA-binding SARP family transcriptional activator/tetratricopeptide (TPR) repeat protein